MQTLQNELHFTKQEFYHLQKINRDLSESASQLNLQLLEEKSEKKELLQQYHNLQISSSHRIEQLGRKYYLLLGLFWA